MADIQYTTVPGKLKSLLLKLREVGIPSKASIQWLKSLSFTSSNDSSLITILKFINFADSSGIPTDYWRKYRGSQYKIVLGDAIQVAYKDLFNLYPDAYKKSDQELSSYFSTNTGGGKQVIGKMVSTFKTLCENASFKESGLQESQVDLTKKSEQKLVTPESRSPSIHFDIQIHISPDVTNDQIDKIFESMSKHLKI